MYRALKYIYFYIFNSYYKDGNYRNDIPWFTSLGIIAFSLSLYLVGLFLLVQEYILFNKFINFSFELTHILLFGLSVWLVLYLLLIKDGKYLEIYEQYKSQRSTLGKLLAWGITLLSFLMFFIALIVRSQTS